MTMTMTAPPQEADADVHLRLRAGDYRAALEILLPRYRDRVFRLAISMQMNPLQAVEAALSRSFSQATLDESFDCKVLERIASAANADRVAARARIERDRQDQMTALSHRWRNASKSMVLNALASVALLIALSKALGLLPFVPRLIDQLPLLTHYTSMHPAMLLPAAAGLTVVALCLVRFLASTER
jgi:hypothetical protein